MRLLRSLSLTARASVCEPRATFQSRSRHQSRVSRIIDRALFFFLDHKRNTFVIEYVGEVLSQAAFVKRTKQYAEMGQRHFYFMSLKHGEFVDATRRGGIARFMNHSCNSNCHVEKWIVNGRFRMGIFTQRTIRAGEELTFDYKFERYG